MITLNCDNCEKPFQVDDDAAGEKVTCPYCGDVNRVPGTGAAEKAGGALADRPSAEAEEKIAVVRTAMFRAHPFWYALMALMGLAGLILAIAASISEKLNDRLAWLGLAGLAAAVIWWVFWWAAPHRWVKLTITSKRTIRQEGIIVRKTSEVLHNHIRNVKIEQSFLQRLLNVGSISIDSAGGSEDEPIEIEMHDVPGPYAVKAIIDRYRKM